MSVQKRREPLAGGSTAQNGTVQRNTTASSLRWAVLAIKSSGARIVFNTYADEIEAYRVAHQLLRVNCYARVELARRGDMPGRQRGSR
ncbi:MAG: hypothetical protein IT521_15345 [Burkholderiales bacterium]|nr:hypothetical protein [Burkholderiales bacterium]